MNIISVVVTYNRKKLLIECIDSILAQTIKCNKVIIIDNASTDNTKEELEKCNILKNKSVEYFRLKENIGGAGGFYTGIKESLKFNPDWVWIMDDDTIPTNDCLEDLVNALEKIKEKNISFLASNICGIDNCMMNVPIVNTEVKDGKYPDWSKYLKYGIVKIKEATFVSLLINAGAIKKCGLPVKDYFIWGDDTEYTLRLNKYYGSSFLIGKSEAIHKRKITKQLKISQENDKNRIKMYYYMIRNTLINKKTYFGRKNCFKYFLGKQVQSLIILFNPKSKYRWIKFYTIHKGLYAYLFKIFDYRAFKNRLNLNVKYKDEK